MPVSLLTLTHPDYDQMAPDYVLMDDTYAGERTVKAARFTYLPATAGQVLDGAHQSTDSLGFARYQNYLTRAVYPDYVAQAVQTLVGVLNRSPARIQLPPQMEPMMENATRRGEGLPMLLRRIHEHQLRHGRMGLLADALRGRPTPILVDYAAPTIRNWSDEPFDTLDPFLLRLVVLDESRNELRDGLAWTYVNRARVLFLTDDTDPAFETPASLARELTDARTYRTFTEDDSGRGPVTEPSLAGRTLPFIPFTVIGSTDLALKPGPIPLLGLARGCLAIYRGEADYRHALHLQGQDTLVVIGQDGTSDDDDEAASDQPIRVGAGSTIHVPVGGDAKFIVASAAGLSEQRNSIGDDRKAAQELGARLLTPPGSQAESGEALRIRVAASTASLQSVALTAAFGLQTALRQCAQWMGLDPESVIVEANLNFAEVKPDAVQLSSLMDAKEKGAPLSLESVHRFAAEGDLTEMTFEDEMAAIEKEKADAAAEAEAAGLPAPGTVPDEEPEDDDEAPTTEDSPPEEE